MVSIILPVFNGERFIRDCLDSVLRQNLKDIEILVIDDGSTDRGLVLVEEIANKHQGLIRILKHPGGANRGISATRNLGIRSSKGEFIAFIDQDDIWLPGKLSRQVEALVENPRVSLVYSKVALIDDTFMPTSEENLGFLGRKLGVSLSDSFSMLLNENSIPALSVVCRKECLLKAGLFDEQAPHHHYEDWLLWCKIAFFTKILFIPEVLAYYRVHGRNYSLIRKAAGLDLLAEKEFLIRLYSYLVQTAGPDDRRIDKAFSKSLRRLLLRARSWGGRKEEMYGLTDALVEKFPHARNKILITAGASLLLPPFLAKLLRRLRRKLLR